MQGGDLGSVPPGLLPQLPRLGREQARGEEEEGDIQPTSDKSPERAEVIHVSLYQIAQPSHLLLPSRSGLQSVTLIRACEDHWLDRTVHPNLDVREMQLHQSHEDPFCAARQQQLTISTGLSRPIGPSSGRTARSIPAP